MQSTPIYVQLKFITTHEPLLNNAITNLRHWLNSPVKNPAEFYYYHYRVCMGVIGAWPGDMKLLDACRSNLLSR